MYAYLLQFICGFVFEQGNCIGVGCVYIRDEIMILLI